MEVAFSLGRRTWYRAIGAEDTTIALPRPQASTTPRALINKHASIGRHGFGCRVAAHRTKDGRLQLGHTHHPWLCIDVGRAGLCSTNVARASAKGHLHHLLLQGWPQASWQKRNRHLFRRADHHHRQSSPSEESLSGVGVRMQNLAFP
jgi:hypothetical protein